MKPPAFADVLLARRTIVPYLRPTPLYHYHSLGKLLGAGVWVKHENHQPIGAFKVRGGVNLMAHLPPEQKARGVITASTGNHGQSVAFAARLFGVRAIVAMPEAPTRPGQTPSATTARKSTPWVKPLTTVADTLKKPPPARACATSPPATNRC